MLFDVMGIVVVVWLLGNLIMWDVTRSETLK